MGSHAFLSMESYRKAVDGRISGTVDLVVDADTGTATVALGDVPTRVLLGVEGPDGGVVIYPVLTDTRSDGFDFELSAAPPATGYKLHYICDF